MMIAFGVVKREECEREREWHVEGIGGASEGKGRVRLKITREEAMKCVVIWVVAYEEDDMCNF